MANDSRQWWWKAFSNSALNTLSTVCTIRCSTVITADSVSTMKQLALDWHDSTIDCIASNKHFKPLIDHAKTWHRNVLYSIVRYLVIDSKERNLLLELSCYWNCAGLPEVRHQLHRLSFLLKCQEQKINSITEIINK